MFCKKCGKEIDNDSTFCPYCGQRVGAPVESRRIDNSSNTAAFPVKKFMPAIAVAIVVLLAVVGITKLVRGSDKESVSVESNEAVPDTDTMDIAEAVEEDVAEEVEEGAISEPESTESEVDNDGVLSVYSWEFRQYLEDFFDLQSEIIAKARSSSGRVNEDSCRTIDTLLEHSGTFILDERLNIPADYDPEAFNSGMRESARTIANEFGGFALQHNRPAEYYALQVSITDSNIGNKDFKYYPGTDAVIYIKCKLSFLCPNSAQYSMDLWRDCSQSTDIYASFVKSTDEGWLLSGLTMDESSVDLSNKLIDENNKYTTYARIDGIKLQAVIDAYARICSNMPFYYDKHALINMDDDNIPELILRKEEAYYEDDIFVFSYQNGAVVHLAETGGNFEFFGSEGVDLSDLARIDTEAEFCEHENAVIYHRYLPGGDDVWDKVSIENGTFVCRVYDTEDEAKAGADFRTFGSIDYYDSLSDAFEALTNTLDE